MPGREGDAGGCPARAAIGAQCCGRLVLRGNFLNDGKAKSAAFRAGIVDAIKALKNHFSLSFGKTNTVIFHLKQTSYVCAADSAGHLAAARGVAQRIVDQVLDQFTQ